MNISKRLFKIMKEKGVKAVEVAKKLNINKSTVSNWKSRETTPPAEYIVPICELLQVSPYYLLTGKEPAESTEPLTGKKAAILEAYEACSPERQKIIDEILNIKTEQKETEKLYISKIG